jgi:phage-related protein
MTAPGGASVIGRAIIKIIPDVKDFAKKLRQQLHSVNSQLRGLQRDLRPVNNSLRFLAKNATGIVPGIKLASLSLRALAAQAVVGGIISLSAAVYEMAGALFLIPAGAVAAASAMGTLRVGFSGVDKALKDFPKGTEEFTAHLDGMSKNARKTGLVLESLRSRLDTFRNSVQDALFAGMDRELSRVANKLLPLVQKHFVALAKIFNQGGKQLSSFLTQASTVADLRGITKNIEGGFRALLPAIKPVSQAILDVVSVGADFLPEIGERVSALATKFSEFISRARESGQLRQWIAGGLDALEQLGRSVGNLVVSIHSLLKTARESGLGLMDTIEKLTQKIRDFLTSAKGQNAVRDFLTNAREAAQALTPVIGAAADAFFNHLIPALVSIGKTLAPAVTTFIHGLSEGIDAARPGIEAFARGFGMFLQAITPALPAIGEFIGAIGRLVGVLSAGFGPAIASVVQALSGILVPVLNVISSIMSLLPEGFYRFITVLGLVIAAITGVIVVMRGFISFAQIFATSLSFAATAAGGATKAMGAFATLMRGPWGIAISAAVALLGTFALTSDSASFSQSDLSGAAQELNAAIREQNGIIDENIRKKAAQQLSDQGALDLAGQLGISSDTLVDAYLGQGDALEYVRGKLEEIANTKVTGGVGVLGDLGAQKDAATQLLGILNGLVGGREADTKAQNAQKAAADSATGALNAQRDAYYGLIDAQSAKQNQDLQGINTQIDYQRSLAAARTELSEGAKTLNINTKEGQDNMAVVTQLVSRGNARIAQLKAEKAPITEVNKALQQNERDLLNLLTPYFKTRQAARNFAIQLGLIPKKTTAQIVLEDKAARAAAGSFKRLLDYATRPRTVVVMFNVRGNAQAAAGLPTGGRDIPGLATGGMPKKNEWTLVGENGPELVAFGRAARVFSNNESKDMMLNQDRLSKLTSRPSYASPTAQRGSVVAEQTPINVTVQSQPEVRVLVGDRELKDVVVQVVDKRDRQAKRITRAGTGIRKF